VNYFPDCFNQDLEENAGNREILCIFKNRKLLGKLGEEKLIFST